MAQTVVDIDREKFDHRNEVRYRLKAMPGLSKEVVEMISADKNEPEWMLDFRLKALDVFNKMPMPEWGPSLAGLNLNEITFFMTPEAIKNARKWEDVPEDIRKTFERLGIPQAEQKHLAGAGTQYESDVVYHNLKKEWEEKGVVFLDTDEALQQHPELVKKYFMTTCVPVKLHKFSALHAAVWSGGTYIYVPEGVKVGLPLQAYFRMNAEKMGQFEHTLIIAEKDSHVSYVEGCSAPIYPLTSLHAGCVEVIVKEGARVRYSSVENWSKNTYNLNTKRAVVDRHGIVEWINGNTGSRCTMLYPCSVLKGEHAKSDYIGIAFAGKDQHQDTGHKVYHLAPHTSSTVTAKSISKDGGISSYRGLLRVNRGAVGSKSKIQCDALIVDDKSISNTFPYMKINEKKVDIAHEATVGRISAEQLFYLMSRGLAEGQASQMIVSGFIEPVIKELPLEYAVELNRLIELEMEGSVG